MANTISDELNRLIQAKAGIKSALEEKGLTIGDSSTLDEFPGLIQEMQTSGGGLDTSTIIDLIESDISTLEIPYGTTKIGEYGLYGQFQLQNVYIPESLKTLNRSAFEGCSNLENIYGTDYIESIGLYAFKYIPIKKITLLNVKTIDNNIFSYAANLKTIIIGDKINTIGQNICQNASRVEELIILKSTPPSLSNANSLNGWYKIYVLGNSVDSYKNAGGNWNNVSTRITPLASMSYDSQTYTVTASGRDNVELYIDSSLIDSSVYTFDSTTQAGNHTVTVKCVDPSLGVLDEVSQEITI